MKFAVGRGPQETNRPPQLGRHRAQPRPGTTTASEIGLVRSRRPWLVGRSGKPRVGQAFGEVNCLVRPRRASLPVGSLGWVATTATNGDCAFT